MRILLALSVFIAFAAAATAPSPAQTAGATRVVNSFYAWFFANQSNWTSLSGARQYLTPSLYGALRAVVTEEQKEQAEALDFSPFDGAQEPAQSFTVGKASGGASRALVPVSLRFAHAANAAVLHVVVVHGAGGWRIDDFVYPGNGDLRRALQKALK